MPKLQTRGFIFSLCLLIGFHNSAQTIRPNSGAKTTKDVFNSAVFLENKNMIENRTGEDVLYFSSHDQLNIYFTKKGLIYNVIKMEVAKVDSAQPESGTGSKKEPDVEEDGAMLTSSMVGMQWMGANPDVRVIAEQQNPGYHTYVQNTHGRLKGVSAKAFKTLTYKGLYPGIDVVYAFPDKGGIEYTLMVEPGADVSQVRMAYSHDIKSITTDGKGNTILHSVSGDIIEHAPVTISADGTPVASSFSIQNNTVSFQFPKGYNKNQKLIIDPWVTSLTSLVPENIGFDVDYDYNGNLFVYGAGPMTDLDTTNNFKVAKYGPSGNLMWTFNGMVPSIAWSTATDSAGDLRPVEIIPGNFAADKVTGKVYVGQALDTKGTQVIRLNAAGVFDNFETVADSTFLEDWGLLYQCGDASVIALGGGTSSDISLGVVNTVNGSIIQNNITGVTGPSSTDQDIVCGAHDSSGNLYVLMNDVYNTFGGFSALPYLNTLYKVNSTFNGNIWSANSHFSTFNEANNDPFWDRTPLIGANGNWFNCLAANGQYLFYYDGQNIAAYSLSTGSIIDSSVIPGYTPLMQGGIAVDRFNHLYLGGRGAIKTYTFTGTAFIPNDSIPLGIGFDTSGVTDIKYNAANNLLYVTGKGFAGTYAAVLSTALYSATAISHCDTGIVHISPNVNLASAVFNISWVDSAGSVVRQALNTSDTINIFNGLPNGWYTINVQLANSCAGAVIAADTVVINCTALAYSNDTTICLGQSAKLSATGTPAGGTYLWTPGNFITATITVVPDTTTTYTVTYTPLTGPAIVETITVTINTGPLFVTKNAAICNGDTFYFAHKTYTNAGNYIDTIPNTGGCDSIVTLALSVTPLPVASFSFDSMLSSGTLEVEGLDTVFCLGANNNELALKGGKAGGNAVTWNYTGHAITNDVLSISTQGAYAFTYIVYNNLGCSASVNDTVMAVICEGISQISANNSISLYPNPTTDQLYIKTEGIQPQSITIYDVNGRMIYTSPFKPEIDVQQISSGVYFVEVRSNEGVARKKFVKM